jgi:membrane associated rhomboid family serine protease
MSLKYQTGEDQTHAQEVDAKNTRLVRPPFPYYTIILMSCIAIVFAVQFLTSSDPSFMTMDRASAHVAGFDKLAFVSGGEYWRILTGATLHSGILHVVMNSYAFYSFGGLFEMLSNRAHLAIVFLLSVLGGGLLSLILAPDINSVGASGGIVGLISYLAVYAFRRRQFISAEFRKNLLINIGFILVFGLVLYQVIDNFGHIGGLITGATYGSIQISGNQFVDPRNAGTIAKIFGYIAIGIYVATSILTVLLLIRAR